MVRDLWHYGMSDTVIGRGFVQKIHDDLVSSDRQSLATGNLVLEVRIIRPSRFR